MTEDHEFIIALIIIIDIAQWQYFSWTKAFPEVKVQISYAQK